MECCVIYFLLPLRIANCLELKITSITVFYKIAVAISV